MTDSALQVEPAQSQHKRPKAKAGPYGLQALVLLEHFAAKRGELDEMLLKPATSVPGRRAHVALVECSAKSVHVAPSAVDLWLLALPALESVAHVVDWDGCSWSQWFQVFQNFQRFR